MGCALRCSLKVVQAVFPLRNSRFVQKIVGGRLSLWGRAGRERGAAAPTPGGTALPATLAGCALPLSGFKHAGVAAPRCRRQPVPLQSPPAARPNHQCAESQGGGIGGVMSADSGER